VMMCWSCRAGWTHAHAGQANWPVMLAGSSECLFCVMFVT
jgi:hypothetical protein